MVNGEFVALDLAGKPAFNLLAGFGGGAIGIVLYTFDLLMMRGKDVRSWPLEERRRHLREIAQQLPSIRYSERFDVPLTDLVSAVRQHGLEGIIAKRLGSPYRSGESCGDWLKWRVNSAEEFVIGGYIPGDDLVDSILVGNYEDRDLMYAGRVRAGLTARSRRALVPYFEALRVPRCPFSNLPERTEGHWGEGLTAPKWICAAGLILSSLRESSSWNGLRTILRHPRFAGILCDKDARDVTRDGAA